MTILRTILLSLLILTFAVPASARKDALQHVASIESPTNARGDSSGGQSHCGMLLVLGGILKKEQGLQILECAARNGDKIAIAALYSAHASGIHGASKDMERAEYWAKLGGISTPSNQAGRGYILNKPMGRQHTIVNRTDQTLSPCDHDDPRLSALEHDAVEGDKTASDMLFDLYMRGRYVPCPEVEAALVGQGLLTKTGAGKE